jgi:tetratricopeptide (TPR) repeat protein
MDYLLKTQAYLIRLLLCSFSLILSTLVVETPFTELSPQVWAQDTEQELEETADPLVEIEKSITEAKKLVETASSKKYISKRRAKTRSEFYLKALESFSAALRPVGSYYLEDENEELYQQVNDQMDEVLNKPEVKDAIAKLRSDLIKVLAKGQTEEAMKLVQRLISIDERNAQMKYLLPILITQNP